MYDAGLLASSSADSVTLIVPLDGLLVNNVSAVCRDTVPSDAHCKFPDALTVKLSGTSVKTEGNELRR